MLDSWPAPVAFDADLSAFGSRGFSTVGPRCGVPSRARAAAAAEPRACEASGNGSGSSPRPPRFFCDGCSRSLATVSTVASQACIAAPTAAGPSRSSSEEQPPAQPGCVVSRPELRPRSEVAARSWCCRSPIQPTPKRRSTRSVVTSGMPRPGAAARGSSRISRWCSSTWT